MTAPDVDIDRVCDSERVHQLLGSVLMSTLTGICVRVCLANSGRHSCVMKQWTYRGVGGQIGFEFFDVNWIDCRFGPPCICKLC